MLRRLTMLRSPLFASPLIRATENFIFPAVGDCSSHFNSQFKISYRHFIDLHQTSKKEATEKEKARLIFPDLCHIGAIDTNFKRMTESWSVPFVDAFNASAEVQVYEVSFIDSWLLSLGPVRQIFLKMMHKSTTPQRQIVYSFGDHYDLRKKLQILNLLTGYIFLLDRFVRIRWQGFGLATEEELSSLLSCTSVLLEEK